MINRNDKMKRIIEMYGMPGSGKSTYIASISTGNMIAAGSANRGAKRIIKNLLIFTPYAIVLKSNLKKIVGHNNEYSDLVGYSGDDYINRIIRIASIYHFSCGKLLLDEGIVHRIITYVVAFDRDHETAFRMIDLLMREIDKARVIYIKTDIDTSMTSIRKRNRHRCAFDELDDYRLREYLEKYLILSELVCNTYNFEVMSR